MVRFRGSKSFTLLELAVVIGVLSALSAIVYPITQAVMNHVQRAKAASNLRLIALAQAQFISDFGRAITFSDVKNISGDDSHTANNFAAVLAKYGYIEDVSLWAWDFDYKVKIYKKDPSKPFPMEIYDRSTEKIHAHFKGGTFPLSVVCGVVQCPNFDYRTLLKGKYPAAYSRGLQANGSWMESSRNDNGGVFGTKGGLIAHYDGSVEWCPHSRNQFTNYLTQEKTSKICEAIPNSHQSMDTPQCADSDFLNWTGPNACPI